jgi:hypothetical protein
VTVRLAQAFRLAAAELGMASAAWLFVAETAAAEGDAGVAALRDALGRAWPVLDAVCAAWLAGTRTPTVDAREVKPILEDVGRLVVVGLETTWLDALVAALPTTTRVALVRHGDLSPDWNRVLSNYQRRVEPLELADFQSWAGPRSALLTFVYGQSEGGGTFANTTWLRVSGPDVRTQFRALIGWEVLRVPLEVYPRWLQAIDAAALTHLEPSP